MWVALGLSALLVLPGQAYALSIGQGSYHVKFNDAEALYAGAAPGVLGAPVLVGGAAAVGQVLRGISVLNAFQYHPGHAGVPAAVWDSTVDEVNSVTYDLVVSRVSAILPGAMVEVGFMPAGFFAWGDTNVQAGTIFATPAGGFGGHNDLYVDNKTLGTYTAYSDAPGAGAFLPGGAGAAKHSAAMALGDAYPGINAPADSDLLLAETVFAPLPAALMLAGGGCFACVPGEVFNALLTFDAAGGITGMVGKGFLNIIGGPFGPTVLPGGIPASVLAGYGATAALTPAMAALLGYDLSLEVKFGAPIGIWTAATEDPLHFTVVPEPSSMLLFGTMLAGLGALGRRRLRRRPR